MTMSFFGADRRKSCRRLLVFAFTILLTTSLILHWSHTPPNSTQPVSKPRKQAFVVASLQADETSWIHEHLPDWYLFRYVVDDEHAELAVPKNKAREAMVYLTFIIDAYEELPDLTVFMHSQRYQWHNDDPLYDGVAMLKNLQIPYLISEAYTNLRCVWLLGCPAELKFEKPGTTELTTQTEYPQAFRELFPGQTLPPAIGVACCAQFAVTREAIQSRPKEEYEHWRKWILDTSLPDHISGRIFEYSWHFIFGKPHIHCPNSQHCYCNVYGLCDLKCDGESHCGERWPYPPFSKLPDGWPTNGWKGESRDEEALDRLRNVAMRVNETAP